MRQNNIFSQAQNFSPVRENYNLVVDDIPGARPKVGFATKNVNHYYDKIQPHNEAFIARQMLQEDMYAIGSYHEPFNQMNSQKKHYGVQNASEINHYDVMKRNDIKQGVIHKVDFPRNLCTQDIEGASPGTLMSKTVMNHDLANRLRENGYLPAAPQQDALDRFQQQVNSRRSPQSFSHNEPMHPSYPGHQTNASLSSSPTKPHQQRERELQHQQQVQKQQEELQQQLLMKQHQLEQQQNIPYQPRQYYLSQQNAQQNARNSAPNPPQHQNVSVHEERFSAQDPNLSQQDVREEIAYEPRQSATNQSFNQQNMDSRRQSVSGKRSKAVEEIGKQIVTHQAQLTQSIQDTLRGRTYNIITGHARPLQQAAFGKQAYGSSLNGMIRNHEDIKHHEHQAKAWAPSGQIGQYQQGQMNSYQAKADSQSNGKTGGPSKDPYALHDVAGMSNDYAETNFRYANKQGEQEPLQKEQMYGIRALKNLSGVRLY